MTGQMIRESEREIKLMMKEPASNDDQISAESDEQIKKNINQTYLFKLQEVTRQLRSMEKEYLKKMTDLYGQEGDVLLDQIERKERDFFADVDSENIQKNQ